MNTVTVDFKNVSFPVTGGPDQPWASSGIGITNGTIVFDATTPLSMAGTITFTMVCVGWTGIDIWVESGNAFTASVVIPVDAPGNAPGDAPWLVVRAFEGVATVTWPTSGGFQTQALTAGESIQLDGYSNQALVRQQGGGSDAGNPAQRPQ